MSPAERSWIVMPAVDNWDMTQYALYDCLEQQGMGAIGVLLVQNGSSPETRRRCEAFQEYINTGGPKASGRNSPPESARVLTVYHNPPLGGPPFGALNASWNFALEFCWSQGAKQALVVNNDLRLAPWTYEALSDVASEWDGLFVSAVGVKEEQYRTYLAGGPQLLVDKVTGVLSKGGPDFSCFLISQACHKRYPFDPRFTYFGDNDYHRTIVLGGDGERIFGVNVPYLHHGSATVNRGDERLRERYAEVFREHQKLYAEKWGGLPGSETKMVPFSKHEAPENALAEVRKLQVERPPVFKAE